MDHNQYKAAAKGDIGHFEGIADNRLKNLVTHNKNTVLHVNIASKIHRDNTVLHVNIASQTHINNREGVSISEFLEKILAVFSVGKILGMYLSLLLQVLFNIVSRTYRRNREGERLSTEFVERILGMYPPLLQQINAKGDAPLHVAARCGQDDAVRALIEFARQQSNQDLEIDVESTVRDIIGMTNDEKNTALHEAVQSGSLDVVKILLEADPAFPYSANVGGETPLYLAAAMGREEIVAEILQKCPSAAHDGPSGKTALHAAVCSGSQGATKLLLNEMDWLTREQDQYGWTPLHYAAYFGLSSVELLLKADISPALIPNDDRRMTALHLAAGQGNVGTVRLIIEHCQECCELVDDRGWNVLHFAMVSFMALRLKDLVGKYPVVRNLIFEKDVKGNTPFHVLAAVAPQLYNVCCYGIFPPEIAKGYYQAVNKQNISAEHINRYGFPDLEQEIQELCNTNGIGQYPNGVVKMNKNKRIVLFTEAIVCSIRKALEYHLVVAALIATVTFAAAFALPGGYKSDIEDGPDRGTAILSQKANFQVFIVSDAIALVLSLSAVIIYFILSLDFFEKIGFLFFSAFGLTVFAMAAMMIAFVTGISAMLGIPFLGPVSVIIVGMNVIVWVIYLIYFMMAAMF